MSWPNENSALRAIRSGPLHRTWASAPHNCHSLFPEKELVGVPDSKHVFKPEDKNCEVRQIAIRRNEASVVTKRFVIDEKLWKKPSERDKAGLILHEIIYEHLFKLGEEDSVKARSINGYIFSDKAFQDGPETYWKMIKDFKLPIYL